MLDYTKRVLTFVSGMRIQGEIRNDETKSKNNKAFNEFVELLAKGENLLNAKRDVQKKFGIQIEYDTVFPENIHQKSTLVVKVG